MRLDMTSDMSRMSHRCIEKVSRILKRYILNQNDATCVSITLSMTWHDYIDANAYAIPRSFLEIFQLSRMLSCRVETKITRIAFTHVSPRCICSSQTSSFKYLLYSSKSTCLNVSTIQTLRRKSKEIAINSRIRDFYFLFCFVELSFFVKSVVTRKEYIFFPLINYLLNTHSIHRVDQSQTHRLCLPNW